MNEPYRIEYVEEERVDFLFDSQLHEQSQMKKNIRMFTSYIIILLFCAADMYCVYRLFVWGEKENQTKKENNETDLLNINYYRPYIVAGISGVQIKVFSVIYDYVATFLTNWENHEKETQFSNNLTLKIVIFEFVNNYTSLFYIAFLKGYLPNSSCGPNGCTADLATQLYIILASIVFFNVVEIGIPSIGYLLRRKMYTKSFLKKGLEEEFAIGSVHHEMFCEEFDNLRGDYNELLILFGYVVFFSIAAPLTPLIIFCIIIVEQMVDFNKLVKLSRVSIIEGANGIEIYNRVFKVFSYIGMLSNIGLIIFSSYSLGKTSRFTKVVFFLILENLFLLLNYIINYNYLPSWYHNIPLIKSLYQKKYFIRDTDNLPHNQLIQQTIKEKEEMLYDEYIREEIEEVNENSMLNEPQERLSTGRGFFKKNHPSTRKF